MPAENMVATPELRFVPRMERIEDAIRVSSDPNVHTYSGRVIRILQQRWVVAGTFWGSGLTAENSEWRDVPLVEGE